VHGAGRDLGELRAIQDWQVRPPLAGVEGVAEVASVGGMPRELQVTVDPQKLSAAGLSIGTVTAEIRRALASPAGQVAYSPTAEFFVRTTLSTRSASGQKDENETQAHELQIGRIDPLAERVGYISDLILPTPSGAKIKLADLAHVSLGPGPRRGVLEMDGNEVVGGVVLMRYGESPLDVAQRLKEKLIEIAPSLPEGVYVTIGYDRSPLIRQAVGTVTSTLLEAIVVASLCVVLVLLHFRTSLVIAVSLPLAVLCSFGVLWGLRASGLATIETNIMSLAGLAISIGVLVDSSIVMAENVMHHLHRRFGDEPVRGDVRQIVIAACQQVGRPIFFSVMIMLLSFLPVFALGGLEGRMFRPLAVTKTLALLASALLAVTLVPALCTVLVRGRIRSERDSPLVRGLMDAYLPLLRLALDRPAWLVWVVAVTFLVGLAPLGLRLAGWPVLLLAALTIGVLAIVATARGRVSAALLSVSLVLVALVADRHMQPLASEFITPLDEGTAMDMPITVPRASVSQAADDLKARDMVLCRFPEVAMVMGKAGRADTPTDPAPIDMIETMISFRPQEFWPRRKISASAMSRCIERTLDELVARRLIEPPAPAQRAATIADSAAAIGPKFDVLMREVAWQQNREHQQALSGELALAAAKAALRQAQSAGAISRVDGGLAALLASKFPATLKARLAQLPTELEAAEAERWINAFLEAEKYVAADRPLNLSLLAPVQAHYRQSWRDHVRRLDLDLSQRASLLVARLALEDLLTRLTVRDEKLTGELAQLRRFRLSRPQAAAVTSHHGTASYAPPQIDPLPVLDGVQGDLAPQLARHISLARASRQELSGFGGEMDQALQMPGWTNVWTMPIQNRVDMLATGVNTTVGIRVLGSRLDDVVSASQQVAEVLKHVPGASDVVADPVRGKGYLDIDVRPAAAAQLGIPLGNVNDAIEAALGGTTAAQLSLGRERMPVRVRFPPSAGEDVEALKRLIVGRVSNPSQDGTPTHFAGAPVSPPYCYLGQVADIAISEGPASIKSENGSLRNYVRLNVRGRDAEDFVREARQIVAQKVALPAGVRLEWTGQFEHQARAKTTLWLVAPLVLLVILGILYFTYRDLADALLVVPAVIGALAGGLLLQWLLGYTTSVTVAIGYLACFGMAAATGIIMLVYLRDAVEQAGGIAHIGSLAELREAVIRGAAHRLRPKLLTEATTILGLAPLLWATGIGSEVIRPMTAPVLGGILVADEVIDLLLPVMFYWVRRRRWEKLHGGEEETGDRGQVTAMAATSEQDSQASIAN
jgi:Cu(I)/Ag(I) efflux system membrane protein CusA/SilA